MDYSGKTLVCNVLFLDIVGYSRKSVVEQISVKERFNAYLAAAIERVPIEDRIILDTGDGAAINFLGDVEDALNVALSMQKALRAEAGKQPALAIRMGINLGPVRLIRDINGRPNIIGDGINSSQRVMGFADPGQILVSRPYYDAMSNLSSKYVHLFRFEGARTDKHHVREYEVYAIAASRAAGLGATRAIVRNPLTILVIPFMLLMAWMTGPSVLPRFRAAPPAAPAPPAFAPPAEQTARARAPALAQATPATGTAIAPPASAAPAPGGPATLPAQAHAQQDPPPSGQARLRIFCAKGTEALVDSRPRGKIRRSEIVLWVNEGRHLVTLVLPPKSVEYDRHIVVRAGKTTTLGPHAFCGRLK
ncbi:MAG TPA: adenylate/guanylate cyclase domain-containing protein [Gallionellaceae bacterium]|nr:adenylate/guanylate cyclase domain-containing protein [Gallionellaceae bacterium]